jgi:hypothetical protein
MRETTLLAIAVMAALLGMGLGHLLLPKRTAPRVATAALPPPAPPVVAVTKIIPESAPPDPVDPNSTPEAIHAWRRQDKDAIVQRVDTLSTADAEHLCFVLQLIPRDEIFDKINVKGRLKRHIGNLRSAAEFTEIEMAFHELERDPVPVSSVADAEASLSSPSKPR